MQKNASYGSPIGIFSGSTMKIIACIIMLIDHAGLILFPSYGIFRVIGRIGFPLFAYFIADCYCFFFCIKLKSNCARTFAVWVV